MPDIIITPNDGTIEFIPSSSTVNKIEASGNTLNLINTSNSNGTIFNIEGTNGSLFSVVDDLSGTLMSVNNNSGLPVFEVFNDDKIIAGRFNKNDFVLSNDGYLGIGTAYPSARLNVEGGNVIFNDIGENFDFRVEGDTDPNLLFVDASVDDVGIGTNNPTEKLDVNGSIKTRAGGVGHEDNGCYIAYPGGGTLRSGTATQTGYLKITLPVSWTSTMIQFELDLYEYSTGLIKKFRIGGYNFSGSSAWFNPSVMMDSDNDSTKYRVHFGHDGTYCAIYISEINSSNVDLGASSTWAYSQGSISNFFGGWGNFTMANWADGWSIGFTTTLGTITNARDSSRPYRQNDTSYVFNEYGGNVDFRVEGDTDANLLFIDASTDRIGISTAGPDVKLQVNESAAHDNNYVYDTNGLMIVHPTPTSSTILNDPKEIFYIVREGTSAQAFGAAASFSLSRYENSSTNSRTRLDIDLAHGAFLGSKTNVMTMRSDGNVGIGTSTPAHKLDVNGTFSANSINVNDQFTFPTSDGSSGQSLVTNGSGIVSWTSLTNITRGSFTPSSSQSVFTVNDGYAVGGLDVYYNGIKLLSGTDYTATNGTSFTLTNTAVSGDIVEYVALSAASMDANTIRGSVAASDGQTVFNVSGGYTVGNLDVFLNGIKLLDGTDFTATNGTSITLTSAASLGDVLEYNAYGLVVASNGLQKTGDSMTGNLTLGSNSILFDSSVIDNNSLDINICNGRLTLESGVPVSTTDQTARTTLYFTPYNGNRICLYDTSLSKWKMHSFSQLSLSLSGLVANTNYDVFVYDNSGTLTLETTAWTDNTTRATELTTQDNIYVKTGAVNRRYLGTIRTTSSTGQCEDSVTKRFVWNYYNREERLLRRYASGNWTYATAAWRVFAGASASTYSVDVVTGLSQDSIFLKAGLLYTIAVTTSTIYYIAVAQDSSINIVDIGNTNNAVERVQSVSANQTQLVSELDHIVPLGYHYYYPIEYRESGGTPTLYATNTTFWGGLLGTWRC